MVLATARRFPFEELPRDCHFQDRFGLGYDSRHSDYKIVHVLQKSASEDGGPFTSSASIYSLKSNSWKTINGFSYAFHPGKLWGNYLNDALHTVVRDDQVHGSEARIMAFDVGKEEHYEVPKPELGSLEHVAVMAGCLTAVVSREKNNMDVWVMKEYGVKDSWTKLLCFVPPTSEPRMLLDPLAYSKSSGEMLLNYNKICLNWYGLRTKKVRIACVDGLSASFDAEPSSLNSFACVASPVSPHSPATLVAEKQEDFLSTGFKLAI